MRGHGLPLRSFALGEERRGEPVDRQAAALRFDHDDPHAFLRQNAYAHAHRLPVDLLCPRRKALFKGTFRPREQRNADAVCQGEQRFAVFAAVPRRDFQQTRVFIPDMRQAEVGGEAAEARVAQRLRPYPRPRRFGFSDRQRRSRRPASPVRQRRARREAERGELRLAQRREVKQVEPAAAPDRLLASGDLNRRMADVKARALISAAVVGQQTQIVGDAAARQQLVLADGPENLARPRVLFL